MSDRISYCFLGGWGTTPELWRATVAETCIAEPHFLSWLLCLQNWPAALAAISALPGRCILVGWSLGALLALRAALELSTDAPPDKLAALVLASATPRMTSNGIYEGVDPRILTAMRARFRRTPDVVLDEFASQCVAPDAGEAARQAYLHQTGEYTPAELASGLQALAELDLRPRLASIGLPCLLLHGSDDRIVPLASARFLVSRLPHAELKILQGCGHALPFTHPAKIAHCIADLAAGAAA